MYNEDLKARFIRHYTQSVSTANSAVVLFNSIERIEKKYNSDYASMTIEQATEAINATQTLRASSMEYRIAVLKSYVNWCCSSGIDGVNMDLIFIEPSNLNHIRHMMIKNPIHMHSILDKVYAPIEEKSIENIYRFYLWMMYSGMNEEQIMSCTKDDIDYKRMEIAIGKQRFPIYRESLDVVVFCADAKELAERHALMIDSRDVVPRYQGNELYRTIRKINNKDAVRTTITGYLNRAYKSGKIDMKLTRKSIHLSGIFYRMYEREINGFPVDFTEDAINEMQGKEYKVNGRFTMNVKTKRIMRDFEEDYANWKTAFNL